MERWRMCHPPLDSLFFFFFSFVQFSLTVPFFLVTTGPSALPFPLYLHLWCVELPGQWMCLTGRLKNRGHWTPCYTRGYNSERKATNDSCNRCRQSGTDINIDISPSPVNYIALGHLARCCSKLHHMLFKFVSPAFVLTARIGSGRSPSLPCWYLWASLYLWIHFLMLFQLLLFFYAVECARVAKRLVEVTIMATSYFLMARSYSLTTRSYSVMAMSYSPYSLMVISYSLMTKPYSLMARSYSLITKSYSLIVRSYSVMVRFILS